MVFDFMLFVFIFWLYYFVFGIIILCISILSLISVIDIKKMAIRSSKHNSELESSFLKFLNFAMILFFWPLISLVINIVAYLILIGKIDEDQIYRD